MTVGFFYLFAILMSITSKPDYHYDYHNVKNGLPSNFVKHLFEDSLGNKWIATDFGLVLMRGNTKKVYRTSFLSPYVKQVANYGNEDSLLFITSGDIKIAAINGTEFNFIDFLPVSTEATQNAIHSPLNVFAHSKSRLWFSEPEGFSYWDGKKIHRFNLPKDSYSGSIYRGYQFSAISDDEIVITAQTGYVWIFNYLKNELRQVLNPKNVKLQTIDALFPLEDKLVSTSFLIGGEEGLYRLNLKGKPTITKLLNLKQVISIVEAENKNEYWVATKANGIFLTRLNTQKIEIIESLPSVNKVKSLLIDSDHNLWVGYDEGVQVVRKQLFTKNSLPTTDSFVGHTVSINDSTFLLATKKSIYKVFVNESLTNSEELIHLENDAIASIAFVNNSVYIGDFNGTIRILDSENKSTFFGSLKDGKGLYKPTIVSQLIEGDGLWAISSGQSEIHHFDFSGIQTIYSIKGNTDLAEVRSAVYDSLNKQLILVSDGKTPQITSLDLTTKEISVLSEIEKVNSDEFFLVQDVQLDSNQIVWISTSQGLLNYDLKVKTTKPKWLLLPPDFRHYLVRSIMPYKNSFLWIAAEHGLFLYHDSKIMSYSTELGLMSDMITNFISSPNSMVVGHINGFSAARLNATLTTKDFVVETVQVKSSTNSFQHINKRNYTADSSALFALLDNAFPTYNFSYFWKINSGEWKEISHLNDIQFTPLTSGWYEIEFCRVQKDAIRESKFKISFKVDRNWNSPIVYGALLGILVVLFILLGFYLILLKRKESTALKILNQTREQIQHIVNSSPVFLFSTSPVGLITLLEGRAYDGMNIDKNSFLNTSIFTIFNHELFKTAFSAVLNGNTQNLVIDRNSKSYELNMLPVIKQGMIKAVTGIGVDITDQVHSERYLRLANQEAEQMREQAEQANKAKTKFLANMSHELRTPLNAIIGYAQLLNVDSELNVRQRQFIKTMQASGHHLLNMINDILDLSKIEAGQLELVDQVFSIRSLIAETENIFKLQAKDKGLNLSIDMASYLPNLVEADDHKIRQILMNLIGNAVKYTEKGSITVNVWIKEKHSRTNFNTNLFVFEFHDTGRGIPEDQLADIFLPFKQVKGHFSKGTGLGLTITKNLGELMSGIITVKSTVGEGSVFKVELPLRVLSDNAIETVGEIKYKLNSTKEFKALIVDDIDSNRILLDELLQSVGFKTISTSSGKEALVLFAENKFDLMLLDLNMPNLSGEEVLKIMRDSLNLTIPVIAVTAQTFFKDQNYLKEKGFNGYISKPFLLNSLLDIIKNSTENMLIPVSVGEKSSEMEEISTSMDVALSYINSLDINIKQQWLDALEMTDMDQLFALIKEKEIPIRLKNAVTHNDFKYLLHLDERLNTM